MASKRKAINLALEGVQAPHNGGEEELLPKTPEQVEEEDEARRINDIIKANDLQNGHVRLERKGPTDLQFQYVASIPIEQFDVEQIKRIYGGGDYVGKTYRSNGQIFKPVKFSVDYRMKGSLDDQQIKELSDGRKGRTDGGPSVWDVAKTFQSNDTMVQTMTKVMEQRSKDSENMMMMMMAMMTKSQETVMACMAQAMAAFASGSGRNNAADQITPAIVDLLKESRRSPVVEVVESMKSFKSLFSGKEDKEEKEETMTEKLIRLLGPSVVGALMPRVPQMMAAPMLQAAAPTIEQHMQAWIARLCKAADNGSDPVAYYQLLLDQVPENLINQVRQMAANDAAWNQFCSDQRIAQRKQWFDELRDLVVNGPQDTNDAPQAEVAG